MSDIESHELSALSQPNSKDFAKEAALIANSGKSKCSIAPPNKKTIYENKHSSISTTSFMGKMNKKQIRNLHIPYHRLNKTDDKFVESQFQKPQPKVPYRGIIFAALLLLMGTVLIIVAFGLLFGLINANNADAAWPLLILGFLIFIPGLYHVRIAYFAYRGYHGYDFDDVPDFD